MLRDAKGWTSLNKRCLCGELMTVKLRTVIYSGKVEIDNVPIYSCLACSRSEVFPEVKPDLTGLIDQLGTKPAKQTFSFNEWNEWANLLLQANVEKKQPDPAEVERLKEARVNSLLDLFLLARSLNDSSWENDLQKRLSQITRKAMNT
jgi:hypothetical protein